MQEERTLGSNPHMSSNMQEWEKIQTMNRTTIRILFTTRVS
jgi:hypothetical protein